MNHPIGGNRTSLLAYVSIWIILSVIQMLVLISAFELQLVLALIDSLVVNIIHSVVGLAIWYPIRFNPVKSGNYFAPIVNILATSLLTVFIWLGGSYITLSRIFSDNETYLVFLNNSLPLRAIIDMLIFVILVLVFSLIAYSLNLKEKISNENNLRTLVREAELNMLKTQINPHFIFNSLNSLSLLTKKNPEKAREMIIKLSEFLRYSLRIGDKENITLSEELDSMEKYLDIEKIRFGEKLFYKNEIEQEALDYLIPNMILQPIFENAIKHGVYESIKPIEIELKVKVVEKSLLISISNEYDPDIIPEKGAGIGLKNIRDRLVLLYGRYDLIKYSGKNGIYNVSLHIPGLKN